VFIIGAEMRPLYSIITVCYNDYSGLGRTMASIVEQSYDSFEWIVIDGDSADRPLELLPEIGQKNINCQLIIEKDDGIYDAMNKGVDIANGDYCLFLNSGDYFYNKNVLADVKPYLFGNIIVGKMLEIHPDNPERNQVKSWENKKFNRSFFYNRTLPHQATFIRRKLFNLYGGYEKSFKIKGDHDFLGRVCLKPEIVVSTAPVCISVYHVDGISRQMKNSVLYRAEEKAVHKRNFSKYYIIHRKIVSCLKLILGNAGFIFASICFKSLYR